MSDVRSQIRWWQVWRYAELKRQNEESLAALVRERPDFTEADARFFVALCRSGQRTRQQKLGTGAQAFLERNYPLERAA